MLERCDSARRHMERALDVARSSGQGSVLVEVLLFLGYALHWQGNLAEATRCYEDAIASAELTGESEFLIWALGNRCWSAWRAGDSAAAFAAGERAVEISAGRADQVSAVGGFFLAEAQLEAGDPAGCRERMLEAGGGPDLPLNERLYQPRWYLVLTRAELALGELARAEGWAERAEAAAEGLGLPGRTGWAEHARAEVLLAHGDAAGAAEVASSAAGHHSEAGNRITAERCRALHGVALAAAGEREVAIATLESARNELEAFGALALRDQAARELRRLGRRVPRSRATRETDAAPPGLAEPAGARDRRARAPGQDQQADRRRAPRLRAHRGDTPHARFPQARRLAPDRPRGRGRTRARRRRGLRHPRRAPRIRGFHDGGRRRPPRGLRHVRGDVGQKRARSGVNQLMGTVVKRAASAALGVAIALVLPAGAQAATTCSFNGDLLFVEMSADGDIAHLEVGGGGVILVDGASGPVICGPDGPPTVTNTETAAIVDSSDAPSTPAPTDGTTEVEIVAPSSFVPGATLNDEGGGLGEIEFAINLGAGAADRLEVVGNSTATADRWVIGTSGINWNAGAPDPAPDADLVTFSQFDRWVFAPGAGDDLVSAQGGAGQVPSSRDHWTSPATMATTRSRVARVTTSSTVESAATGSGATAALISSKRKRVTTWSTAARVKTTSPTSGSQRA